MFLMSKENRTWVGTRPASSLVVIYFSPPKHTHCYNYEAHTSIDSKRVVEREEVSGKTNAKKMQHGFSCSRLRKTERMFRGQSFTGLVSLSHVSPHKGFCYSFWKVSLYCLRKEGGQSFRLDKCHGTYVYIWPDTRKRGCHFHKNNKQIKFISCCFCSMKARENAHDMIWCDCEFLSWSFWGCHWVLKEQGMADGDSCTSECWSR